MGPYPSRKMLAADPLSERHIPIYTKLIKFYKKICLAGLKPLAKLGKLFRNVPLRLQWAVHNEDGHILVGPSLSSALAMSILVTNRAIIDTVIFIFSIVSVKFLLHYVRHNMKALQGRALLVHRGYPVFERAYGFEGLRLDT